MPQILIIEDDDLMRGLLVEWLSAAGYPVRVGALSGEGTEGTDRSDPAEAPADLMIVNVNRPRQQGAERLRRVREAHPGTPVIAISSQFCGSIAGCAASAQAIGADRMLAKPCGRTELLDAVAAVVGQARQPPHAVRPA